MKKYARLRSSFSFTEHCEPCGSQPAEVPTAVNLDDDCGTTAAPKLQSSSIDSSTFLDGPSEPASSNTVQGEDVSKSASHSVLAEALKKLSSLRATQHEDDSGLPRGVNSSHWVARSNFMIEVDADSSKSANSSSTFSAGKWPRRADQSAGASELGGIHHSRTSSNAGVAAAATALGSMGITRTESCCTHTAHFTHRRSSSMHDIILSQPASRHSPMATIHTDQHRRRAGKGGLILVPPGFPDDEESGWSPPQLLRCSTSYSAAAAATAAATAPPGRRLPTDPLQLSCHLWEEGSDAPPGTGMSAANAKRTTGVQSMRYDRWPGVGPAGWPVGEGGGAGKLDQLATWEGRGEMQSQSVREGAAQASAIAAMAQAYAEKYGIARAGVDLECMSCGRGRGTGGILEANSPGSSYDSAFCHSCRPPVVPVQALASAAAASSASTNSKKGGGAGGLSRGMVHYCRKLLLRMGKKPSHKYTLV